MDAFKYFAFISYSHKDKKEAKELYRRLTYYRLPVGLAGEVPEQVLRRLQRDRAEIQRALVQDGRQAFRTGILRKHTFSFPFADPL